MTRSTFAPFLCAPALGLLACSDEKPTAESVPPPQATASTVSAPGERWEAEVMILAESEVPDPTTAPYADCLTHLQAKVLSRDGSLVEEDLVLNLVVPAFENREWLDGGRLRRGCKIRLSGGNFFESASSEVQQMQRVDTINDFDSPVIWVEQWSLLEGILASGQLPPRDEIVAKQLEVMQHKMAAYDDLVIGGVRDGWFFDLKNSDHYKPDFWEGFTHSNPAIQGSYEAILTFHRQLAERGIQLHVAVAPRSSSIYPDLATNVRYDPNVHGRVNLQVEKFIEALRAEGVDMIDLTPVLLQNRWYKFKYVGDGQQRFPVFLPNDHHWSPIGVRLAAREIRRHLVEEVGVTVPEDRLDLVEKKHLMAFAGMPYADWVYPPQPDIPQVFDTPYYTLVPKTEEADTTLRGAATGPIHLIGDSFTWCHKTGNDLRSHLTKELRQPLVFTGAAGGAETNVRRSWVQRLPDDTVQHVVWLIGENSLGDHERWHRVRFGDADVLTWTEGDIEPDRNGVILESVSSEELQIRFGEQPLSAGESQVSSVNLSRPVTLKADSFFDAHIRLVPAGETEASNAPNSAEYHFRLKFDNQLVDEKFEATDTLNWKRQWRVDLSGLAGKTGVFSFEVEVNAGEDRAQEGFPVIRRPSVEGVER